MILTARTVALAGRLEPTDFQLEAGKITCLIGPNGSGKTSLLHALARIGKPAGTVEVGGKDVDRLAPEQRARALTYLPASRDIAWPLLARDVVMLGAAGAGGGDREALFASLGMAELADRRMDRLSTGERARVLLARALVARPNVLLLDEPTANLDPLWKIRMMERLSDEAGIGKRAVMIAVHDLDMAAAHADRLIVMQGGRIVADGDPDLVLDDPVIPAVFGVKRTEAGWEMA
ncbi:ABC transporter ATP-binding protein [Allosphingosinicella flava]|uniref:ABC transporter ATP-binding protein n=1 Tax=Allosphingosinicella flava TaxID=2771430 RepID=A0A7T2LN13_9SPHN|nr:ABC transporter ATP-binding protein [Sphingosinicella flava]QPQ55717.1 ABC transporter ATP-binding protein [Sphingosinicella flava]